jgi:hypothetical protein
MMSRYKKLRIITYILELGFILYVYIKFDFLIALAYVVVYNLIASIYIMLGMEKERKE